MSHTKIAVVAATILLATTACGGSPEVAAATDQSGSSTLPQDGTFQQGGPGGAGFPGVGGKIAAVDGRTVQVQSVMDGQVAVSYTGNTTFTEEVTADASDLEVGDCVLVTGEGDDALAATAVSISPAGDDGCTPQRPGGGPPETQGDGQLQGMPTDPPGGADPPDGAVMPDGVVIAGAAVGEVTAVGTNGFTVETTLPGSDDASSREVTTSADTTWKQTVASTSKAVKVGRCAMAQGDRDDTGAIAATSIAISDAADGGCALDGGFRMEARG